MWKGTNNKENFFIANFSFLLCFTMFSNELTNFLVIGAITNVVTLDWVEVGSGAETVTEIESWYRLKEGKPLKFSYKMKTQWSERHLTTVPKQSSPSFFSWQCSHPFHQTCITHHLCKSVLCWRDIEFITFCVSAKRVERRNVEGRKKWCYFLKKIWKAIK